MSSIEINDIERLHHEISKSIEQLRIIDNPADCDLLVLPYRDHYLVERCGMEDLAWRLTMGLNYVSRHDVAGFFELLERELLRMEKEPQQLGLMGDGEDENL